jgi:hypothetical protein
MRFFEELPKAVSLSPRIFTEDLPCVWHFKSSPGWIARLSMLFG